MDTWLPGHARTVSRTLLLSSKSRTLFTSHRVGLSLRADRFFRVLCLAILALGCICILFFVVRPVSRGDVHNEASWLAASAGVWHGIGKNRYLGHTAQHNTVWAASSGISQMRLPQPYGNLRITFLHASVFGDGDTDKSTLEFLTMLEGNLILNNSASYEYDTNANLHVMHL